MFIITVFTILLCYSCGKKNDPEYKSFNHKIIKLTNIQI